QQDHRTMCCQVGEEGRSGLEERPMFLLWITRAQPFEVRNGILVKSMLVLAQIAVECFDERLVGQLSFLLISRTLEWNHPRCCCPQQLKCQTSLADTGVPCEKKHLPASPPGGAEPGMQCLEFALASGQWSISLEFRDRLPRRHPGWQDGRRRWSHLAMYDRCI